MIDALGGSVISNIGRDDYESSWQHPSHNLVNLLVHFWWICFTAILSIFHNPHFQSVWINLACCYFYLGMYRSSFRAKFPEDCNEIYLVCFLSALQWCWEDDREGGEVEAEDKTPISFVTQVGHHHHWETWLQHDQIRKYLTPEEFEKCNILQVWGWEEVDAVPPRIRRCNRGPAFSR